MPRSPPSGPPTVRRSRCSRRGTRRSSRLRRDPGSRQSSRRSARRGRSGTLLRARRPCSRCCCEW
ncbi:hypothetical protein ACFPRL_30720 [Pseudoclavibacter helvolus]